MWYALEHLSNRVIAKAEKYNECSDEAFRKMPWTIYSPYILTTDEPKECSVCNGRGVIEDYENIWECIHCEGSGYSINYVDK